MAISVVITCYNLERYIAEAIESVLSQDYSGEVEIIVVDDASTDASAKIIQGYARVRHIRMDKNSGVLLATIRGIETASSDLVFFLDGDDIWLPGKLSAVIARMLQDSDLAFITHDLSYIDQDRKLLDQQSIPGMKMAGIPRAQESEMIRKGILMQDDYVWLGSALGLRKSKCMADEFCVWAKSLPDPQNTYQDWPLAFWIAAMPEAKMAYVAEKLFLYRLHGANHSGDASTIDKACRNILRARNTTAAMLDIAERKNLNERVVRSLTRNFRFGEYLLALYSGRRIAALKGFSECLPLIFEKHGWIMKEFARFMLVQFLGVRLFLKLRR